MLQAISGPNLHRTALPRHTAWRAAVNLCSSKSDQQWLCFNIFVDTHMSKKAVSSPQRSKERHSGKFAGLQKPGFMRYM